MQPLENSEDLFRAGLFKAYTVVSDNNLAVRLVGVKGLG